MKKKCDLCQDEHDDLDLFHYEHLVGNEPEEVLVCENCLFDLVEKDFQCDCDQIEILKQKIS